MTRHDELLARLVSLGWEFYRGRDGIEMVQPIPPEGRRAEYAALWDAFRADLGAARRAIVKHVDGRRAVRTGGG